MRLAVAAALTQNSTRAAGVERVTSVEGITEYKLSNGLHDLLFPDPTKQTITVNATYLVGSRYEHYGETGMAHLLEHMFLFGLAMRRGGMHRVLRFEAIFS